MHSSILAWKIPWIWRATVHGLAGYIHGVAKSQSQLSTGTSMEERWTSDRNMIGCMDHTQT